VAIDGAYPLVLDLPTPTEARDLLARRLGPARVAAEPAAVDDIIELCGRLPLALAVVAARAALHSHLPLVTIGRELHAARNSLDAFAGDDATSDVRAVFSWSYRALTPDAARLFRLLGLHPAPDITAPAAASLAATTVPRACSLLAELARAHLVTEHSPGRYTFHDLLHAYATELAHTSDGEHERRAVLHRLLDHYVHTAHAAANRLASPQREPITPAAAQPGVTPEVIADHDSAMLWFTAESSVVLAVAGHANGAGFPAHTRQLAWSLREFLVRRGRWDDLRAVETVTLEAARALADPSAAASAHFGLGVAAVRQGRDDDAHRHYSISLGLYRDLGDQVTEAKCHVNLSSVAARQGRPHDALDHSRQSLRLFRAAGHQIGQANALNAVGWYQAKLGRHRQAIKHCRRALAFLREVGDQMNEAAVWDTLGYAHQGLGEHSDAIGCYLRAIELTRAAGDRYRESEGLSHLADAYHADGNREAARQAWQNALAILDELGHPDTEHLRARLSGPETATADRGVPDPTGTSRPVRTTAR
jgi:Tfp pilus assembly protein PilF